MLQTIREHTQGWIAGTIISVIILTFALWGVHSYFVGGNANVNVAEVNGVPITKMQEGAAYERLKRQIQAQFGAKNPFAGKDELLKKRALQGLIDNEVLKQTATKQGFIVTEDQIKAFVQTMPDFQVDGQFSVERFQQAMSTSMFSINEFLDIIHNNLLIDQPRIGIISSSFSLPDEVTYTVSLINQDRDFDYLTITTQNLTQPITITPDKISAYYEAHKKNFMTPEQVSVDYLQVSLKDISASFNPGEDVLRSYYNDNLTIYTSPIQWKLQSIEFPLPANATPEENKAVMEKAAAAYKDIMGGKDFKTIAEGNTGTLSDKEWLPLTKIPTELQKTVATLTEKGQVTAPVKTSKGYVIIRAVDIQEPKPQTFEEVKNRIRDNYIRQHAETSLAETRDRLADLTYEHPDTLDTAAKELNLTIRTSELFSRDKAGTDISESKKVREVAFSQDVLSNQNNSDVIQINPETLVVVRVKNHVPAKVQPLAEVQGQIESLLRQEQLDANAEKLAQDLLQKLKSGADAQQLATTNKLSWSKAGLVGRFDNKIEGPISETAFRMPDPSNNHNKPLYSLAKLTNGYAIIRLNTVKPGDISDKKQYQVFAEQIQNSDGMLEYELYKLSQVKNANITTSL